MQRFGYHDSRMDPILQDVQAYRHKTKEDTNIILPFPESNEEKIEMANRHRRENLKDVLTDYTITPYQRLINSLPYSKFHDNSFWGERYQNGTKEYSAISVADLRDVTLDVFDRHRELESYVSDVHQQNVNLRKQVAKLQEDRFGDIASGEVAPATLDALRDTDQDLQNQLVELIKIVGDNQKKMDELVSKDGLAPTQDRMVDVMVEMAELSERMKKLEMKDSMEKTVSSVEIPPPQEGDQFPIFDDKGKLMIEIMDSDFGEELSDNERIKPHHPQDIPIWSFDEDIQQVYVNRYWKQHRDRIDRFLAENELNMNLPRSEFVSQIIEAGYDVFIAKAEECWLLVING